MTKRDETTLTDIDLKHIPSHAIGIIARRDRIYSGQKIINQILESLGQACIEGISANIKSTDSSGEGRTAQHATIQAGLNINNCHVHPNNIGEATSKRREEQGVNGFLRRLLRSSGANLALYNKGNFGGIVCFTLDYARKTVPYYIPQYTRLRSVEISRFEWVSMLITGFPELFTYMCFIPPPARTGNRYLGYPRDTTDI